MAFLLADRLQLTAMPLAHQAQKKNFTPTSIPF
jgi:hypothetical protein